MISLVEPAILEKLNGVKHTQNGWEARCPAHDDKNPSLSMTIANDGRLLLCCHKGCSIGDIAGALNLTVAELLGNNRNVPSTTTKRHTTKAWATVEDAVAALNRNGAIATVYDYSDTFRVLRLDSPEDKTFRPLHKDIDGWHCGDPPAPLPLYRMSELSTSGTVYVVEGEKDCDSAWTLGMPTVTSAHGSKSAKKTDWAPLYGRDVVVIPDADEPGKAYAETVAAILTANGSTVKIIELYGVPSGGSVSDFIAAHDSRDADDLRRSIEELVAEASVWEPKPSIPSADIAATGLGLSELWLSERLAKEHGADLRYCDGLGWLAWDDTRWERDNLGEVMRRAKTTVRNLYALAAETTDDKERQRIVAFAHGSERRARLEAIVALARSEVPIPCRAEDLDRDPWAFNVQNGTLDLKTGTLRPHRREDLITKQAPVRFDPDAKALRWDRFLKEIFECDEELIAFVQRAVGAALSGVIRDHVLHVLFGRGMNGKSTLIKAILAMTGDYGMTAPPKMLMAKFGESHPTDLASLRGKRIVTAIESGEGRRLDEDRTKWLTGGDRIAARHMRQDFFEFEPSHTILLATNYKPTIRGTDDGIWRRIRLWPFNVKFEEDEQDLGLDAKLENELPGILTWAVRGGLDWQSTGLCAPDAVVAATTQYRKDEDRLGDFIDEHCVCEPTAVVASVDLYSSYRAFSEASGEKPLSQKRFGAQLTEHGFSRGPDGPTRRIHWFGIGLKT